MERSCCMGSPGALGCWGFRLWRRVDAPGLYGQSGLVGGRDTGSIKGDVVHPPIFFQNFVFDEALSAGLRVIWLKGQVYLHIA